MQFVGHIMRHSQLERLALLGKIEGKRDRGRQRRTYLQSLNGWATNSTISCCDLIHACDDRAVWRNMTTNACIRSGT